MWLVDPLCLQDCLPKRPQMKKYVTILLGNLPWIPRIGINSPLCDAPLKILKGPHFPVADESSSQALQVSITQGILDIHSLVNPALASTYQAFLQAYPSFLLIPTHLSRLSFGTAIYEVPSTSFPTGRPASLLNVLVGILRMVRGVPFTLVLES